LQILQQVETETVNGFKCQVTVHHKLYYCWMFSYSKPIIRAEYKQSMVISAQFYTEMAKDQVFCNSPGMQD